MTPRVDELAGLALPVRPGAGGPRGEDAARELARVAAAAAAAKTSEATTLLDVGELLGITDYFVVTAGRSDRQVRAIVDEVGRRVRDAGGTRTRSVEGLAGCEWVLLDYGSFVVHVFGLEARERFGLERLWSDAPSVDFDPELAGERTSR
ncbi:MAG: ribosome silencing factor [Actinomycetota bacterium]|nr:ribosome silencing factor [Actinomycetota bacterium]